MVAGAIPRRTSENENRVPSSATATSAAATSPAPPPIAAPRTFATTGFGSSSTDRYISARRLASSRFSSYEKPAVSRMYPMSAPAQNDGPSPVRTTTRTFSSSASSPKQRVISAISAAFNAFRASGRANSTVATGPSSARFKLVSLSAISRQVFSRRRHDRKQRPGAARVDVCSGVYHTYPFLIAETCCLKPTS